MKAIAITAAAAIVVLVSGQATAYGYPDQFTGCFGYDILSDERYVCEQREQAAEDRLRNQAMFWGQVEQLEQQTQLLEEINEQLQDLEY